jgi:hypothetical protein
MQNLTNIDALWLASLAERFGDNGDADASRLRAIANNLQGLDETNQNLSNARTYADGYATAELRMHRRSNILTNPDGEDTVGKAILAQIDQRVASGNVKRLALGERGLEDQPHTFNGPTRRKAPAPTLSIDLSFLGDL